jgi:hypothetical protein
MPTLPAFGSIQTDIHDIFSLTGHHKNAPFKSTRRIMRNSRCIAMAIPPALWSRLPPKLRGSVKSWSLDQYEEVRKRDPDSLFNVFPQQALRINDKDGKPIAYVMEKDQYNALRTNLAT